MITETNDKKFYIIFAQHVTYLETSSMITDTTQYVNNLEDFVNSKLFLKLHSSNPR